MHRIASAFLFLAMSVAAGCGDSPPDAECLEFCASLGCDLVNAVCEPSANACACHGCEAYYDEYFGENPKDEPACTPDVPME